MSSATDELVLGIPRRTLMGEGSWRGLRAGGLERHLELIDREGTYRPRREVEDDPAWKQVIPYVVVRDGARLFLLRRTRAGSDQRLHDRYSLGIGGHVNPQDGGVSGGLRREWIEELEAEFEPEFRPLGLLNDDEDAVGAVHIGLVFLAEAHGHPVGVRETHKLSGEFVAPVEVNRIYDRLETWSALLFDFLMEHDGTAVGDAIVSQPKDDW